MVAAVKLIPVELVAKTPPRLKMIKVDFKWCHVYSVSPSLISQCLVVNTSSTAQCGGGSFRIGNL
jgi:hypothetical protein